MVCIDGGAQNSWSFPGELAHFPSTSTYYMGGGEGTPYIRMIGIVVFFRGCNQRFGIF